MYTATRQRIVPILTGALRTQLALASAAGERVGDLDGEDARDIAVQQRRRRRRRRRRHLRLVVRR